MASADYKREMPSVTKVRFGGDSAETRMVLDIPKAVSARVVSDGTSDGRLEMVFSNVSAGQDLQGQGRGLVQRWLIEPSVSGARLQIDLAKGAVLARRFMLPPADGVDTYRYVIDIRKGRAAPEATREAVVPASVADTTRRLSLKKIIVIDAGHGGRDPGAHGHGELEKHVTLAAARQLKSRLEASGRYKVVLTRKDDSYVPLERRVQVARSADADLFISLHADSGGSESVRGASVYTLSEQGASRVGLIMTRNDTLPGTGGDRMVNQILLDLSQRATQNRSASFAQVLIEKVGKVAPLVQRSHRDAGFMVLLAPDVPAVLLEMGFMSNAEDAKALSSDAHMGRLTEAMQTAIDNWFRQQTQVASR